MAAFASRQKSGTFPKLPPFFLCSHFWFVSTICHYPHGGEVEVGGFFGLYFWRFRSKYCPWWRDVPGVENTNGTPFKQWSSREEGGGAVECWPYNNHYSAEMAIRRGLSVLGLETPWLDFPCVALLLCLWIAVACYSPFEYFCRQFNRDPIGCRFQGISWWSAR